MKLLFVVLPFVMLSACSSGETTTTAEQSPKEHILKDQVQALEKAKEVGQLMQNAADQQRQTLDESK